MDRSGRYGKGDNMENLIQGKRKHLPSVAFLGLEFERGRDREVVASATMRQARN